MHGDEGESENLWLRGVHEVEDIKLLLKYNKPKNKRRKKFLRQ